MILAALCRFEYSQEQFEYNLVCGEPNNLLLPVYLRKGQQTGHVLGGTGGVLVTPVCKGSVNLSVTSILATKKNYEDLAKGLC